MRFPDLRFLTIILAASLALPGPAAFAAETGTETNPPEREKRYTWSVTAGGAAVRFDSSYKQTDKDSGLSFFIDPEGNLDLSEKEYVPAVYLLALIKGRHYISAGYTRFHRTSGEKILDEDVDIGDIIIEADARVEFQWDSDDFDVSYGYRIHRDDRTRIILKGGVYVLDLWARAYAEGSYIIEDVLETGVWEEEATLTAPLPLIGLMFDYDITHRWSLVTAVDAVYAPVGDITGRALRTRVHTRYRFTKLLSMGFGLSYFDIDVVDEDDEKRQEIKYGYDGFYIGLAFTF
jgi:hypothetical protein